MEKFNLKTEKLNIYFRQTQVAEVYVPRFSHDSLVLHFLCNEGRIQWAAYPVEGIVLTIETTNQDLRIPTNTPGDSVAFGSSIALQLVQLVEKIESNHKNKINLEIAAASLCSTVIGQLTAIDILQVEAEAVSCDTVRPTLQELNEVYQTVQHWKKTENKIQGSFNDHKPAGMTRKRFLQLVNYLYDASASELIYNLNMQKALNRILHSGEAMALISEGAGYNKKENFIAAFRNSYGISPGQLRKHFR